MFPIVYRDSTYRRYAEKPVIFDQLRDQVVDIKISADRSANSEQK